MCIPVIAAATATGTAATAGSSIIPALYTAGMALTAIGGGVSAYSSIQQGRYLEDVADAETQLNIIKAREAKELGAEQSLRVRIRGKQQLGEQKVAFAGGNVDIGVGSPVDVFAETVALTELDALTVENNAAREAFGYSTNALMSRSRGKQARQNSYLQAGGTILSTGGSLANSGVTASQQGIYS